ncbi:hypothetical protein [Paraburkholderia ginsengiterrae]|uniref:hypothetical protein n=1 Tax=Paraburkholderia ginsengiterrae TaxID=1462993 RepID=UPI0010420949|nr:hypothetical protein [Paraburkholderia ginsengiterrae]
MDESNRWIDESHPSIQSAASSVSGKVDDAKLFPKRRSGMARPNLAGDQQWIDRVAFAASRIWLLGRLIAAIRAAIRWRSHAGMRDVPLLPAWLLCRGVLG